jgi:caa(3)-type oxidase subunit IV
MPQHSHASVHPHGQTHYIRIWAILCALLAVSVAGPMVGIRFVTLVTAFGVAIVKAYIVCSQFMHLNIEKKFVVYILGAMLAFMIVFFSGVAPDVLEHEGQQWQKTYVEPAIGVSTEH